MYAKEVEKTLPDGRRIVCFACNGNRSSRARATVMLIKAGDERSYKAAAQTGVIRRVETTCYKGNVGWSAKKEKELLADD